MKYEPVQRADVADQDSLASDFLLIGQAIADAFRGLSAGSPVENCSCTKIHYAGWR
jgi:hypothetical protein